jgi:predicted transcriptional regulator
MPIMAQKTCFGLIPIRVYASVIEGMPVTKSVFTEQYDRFRQMLIEARKERALTQLDVAERLGKPQSFVSKYERGERRLDVVEFLEVANAVGADPKVIIDQLGSA